jgi:hypothetical protein
MLTPLFPHLFLPLASISNIGKNVAMMASGATRAQMHNSLSRSGGDNLGDITAKMTAQSIAASLTGTALGIAVSHLTGTDTVNIIVAFVPMTALWSEIGTIVR